MQFNLKFKKLKMKLLLIVTSFKMSKIIEKYKYEIIKNNYNEICYEEIKIKERLAQYENILLNRKEKNKDEHSGIVDLKIAENRYLDSLKDLKRHYNKNMNDISTSNILKYFRKNQNTLLHKIPKEIIIIIIGFLFNPNFEIFDFYAEIFLIVCARFNIDTKLVFYQIRQKYKSINIVDLYSFVNELEDLADKQLSSYSSKILNSLINHILEHNFENGVVKNSIYGIAFYCFKYFNQKEKLDFIFSYTSDYMKEFAKKIERYKNYDAGEYINISNYTYTKSEIPIDSIYKNRVSPDEGRLALNYAINILNDINSVKYLFETYDNINLSRSDKFVVSIQADTDKKILKYLKLKDIKTQISNKLF